MPGHDLHRRVPQQCHTQIRHQYRVSLGEKCSPPPFTYGTGTGGHSQHTKKGSFCDGAGGKAHRQGKRPARQAPLWLRHSLHDYQVRYPSTNPCHDALEDNHESSPTHTQLTAYRSYCRHARSIQEAEHKHRYCSGGSQHRPGPKYRQCGHNAFLGE